MQFAGWNGEGFVACLLNSEILHVVVVTKTVLPVLWRGWGATSSHAERRGTLSGTDMP